MSRNLPTWCSGGSRWPCPPRSSTQPLGKFSLNGAFRSYHSSPQISGEPIFSRPPRPPGHVRVPPVLQEPDVLQGVKPRLSPGECGSLPYRRRVRLHGCRRSPVLAHVEAFPGLNHVLRAATQGELRVQQHVQSLPWVAWLRKVILVLLWTTNTKLLLLYSKRCFQSCYLWSVLYDRSALVQSLPLARPQAEERQQRRHIHHDKRDRHNRPDSQGDVAKVRETGGRRGQPEGISPTHPF